MAEWRPTLATWSVATFDLVVLVLAALLVGLQRGVLGAALDELNTVVGVALFAGLWVLVVVAVAGFAPEAGFAAPPVAIVLRQAALAGAAVGGGFVLAIYGLAFVPAFVAAGADPGAVLFLGLLATGVALAVGAVVGLALGALDVALARSAVRLLDSVVPATGERGPASGTTPRTPEAGGTTGRGDGDTPTDPDDGGTPADPDEGGIRTDLPDGESATRDRR